MILKKVKEVLLSFESWKTGADFFLKICSIGAILVGGWWAWHQFNITETTASNIQLNVDSEIMEYDKNNDLLIAHVKLKNIGKVLVEPGKDGLEISVKRIPPHLSQGNIDLEKFPVLYHTNTMNRYKDGYELGLV